MGTEYGANIQLESGNDTSANLIKFQSRGAPKKSGSSYKHTLSKINPKYPVAICIYKKKNDGQVTCINWWKWSNKRSITIIIKQ